MRILLIGSGGREHALAWKLSQSPSIEKLYASPGNPGIGACAELLDLDPGVPEGILSAAAEKGIDLVVVGPEAPLVAGLADELTSGGIAVFGPSRAAAQLEGSKGFTKDLCREAGVPTASYARFRDERAALRHLETLDAAPVVKADGLAAGKGVTVASTMEEAHEAISRCFGQSGAEVVLEERLEGEEASLFVLCDGKTALPFGTARDHKRAGDGDTGPNTGGMGAYAPAPALDETMVERAMAEIVRPTLASLQARGILYRGVLYAGLMLTTTGPQLIEYNVRFGDPECQVLMPRLDGDLAEIMSACAHGRLCAEMISWSSDAALCVVMAARGYPGPYAKGDPIGGLDRAAAIGGVTIFQAGTARKGDGIAAAGGRVLNVVGTGPDLSQARARAYEAVETVDWGGGFYRRDIGAGALT